MKQKSETRTNSTKQRLIRVASFVLILGLLAIGFAYLGYVNYLHDEARHQACEEEFGSGSEWIGNAYKPSRIVCETPSNETELIQEPPDLPMSWETFTGYLDSLTRGLR